MQKFFNIKIKNQNNRAFTLIELLVVVAIIGILSSVVLASLNSAREKARDSRRLSDVRQIQTALDLYYQDYGRYPPVSSDSPSCGGWDTTGDGSFLTILISGGYLGSMILDPNFNTVCSGYHYYRYSASYGYSTPFYVLGVKNMESIKTGDHPSNPGWIGVSRDWSGEFEWVTGKTE